MSSVHYTKEHEWVSIADDSDVAMVGITDFFLGSNATWMTRC